MASDHKYLNIITQVVSSTLGTTVYYVNTDRGGGSGGIMIFSDRRRDRLRTVLTSEY